MLTRASSPKRKAALPAGEPGRRGGLLGSHLCNGRGCQSLPYSVAVAGASGPLASRADRLYLADMAKTKSVRRRGGGAWGVRYRVEVTARHGQPTPWGWQVFRRGETRPIEQSASGYETETDAWSAGGTVVTRLENAGR
jgi:hypothetical protein